MKIYHHLRYLEMTTSIKSTKGKRWGETCGIVVWVSKSLRGIKALTPFPVLVVFYIDLGVWVALTSWRISGLVGTKFGITTCEIYLPDVGAYLLSGAACVIVGVWVLWGRVSDVWSMFGTGCGMCSWHGLRSNGPNACALGPLGLCC